ncbi:putative exocyst complex component Exo70, cullin repeat-like-containing domain superfamily [Helianthus annuus]|uniref:Exocyst subunit Exo70 family protein n=1 Tax=Helianthus annuus TaxID=4232 RepID=A0A9K3IAL0_HELAN|nr:exocyst complex component EXO70B1-like [Helianthus annuus]KAF5792961.1 putative exocyst complex component Exo70, cullin repeat-like-containing domain superfamily [Helianthus annuus]KAJ0544272.1 putative exocyst complex component Exo70, cullin repeat-like-containing domain superfamily [Helianthus annuus]
MAATVEGQDRVLATAQQIVKSLNINNQATEDMLLILSSFDNRLSNISDLTDHRFETAEQVILRHDSVGLGETSSEYLEAVDTIIKLTENLNIQSDCNGEVIDRAENALQLAMLKLEDEFYHVLIRNTVPLDVDRLYGSIRKGSVSFAANEIEIEDDFESSYREDDCGGSSYCYDRGLSFGGDVCVDLVYADAIKELKAIADRMIRSGYEKECCQVYCNVRRDVLDECLLILGVEKVSIEEVQRIEWKVLDEKMKKWIQAVKVVVKALLFGEKQLCEQVFSESELIKEVSFVETTKGCVMQVLNFGEAVAIGQRSSEKLFRILDMYDVVADVLPDFETLFVDESGELVCNEVKAVLSGLGEAAIGTFVEFENAVKGENSRRALQGGEIHPVTRYVMNYLKLLVDYSEILNILLPNSQDYDLNSKEVDDIDTGDTLSPVSCRLLSLITSLEANIEEKSRLYDDNALKYIFLMNNILYIVQKVKDSDLRNLLGDRWIRKHSGQIRQWHTSYLRSAWGKALLCLKDDGIGGGSSSASKLLLKERFKNFNACFEEIYRIQSLWRVPDDQLREELRISISEKVLPAYRAFVGRFGSQLDGGRHSGKYVKYTIDDLENYLSDLFEGKPAVLNNIKRKGT